jgi:N-acetylmuramoyl-L-alanine amidase
MGRLTDMTGAMPSPPALVARLWATLLVLALLLSLPALAAEPVATGTRVGGDGNRTRFVADLTQVVSFSVYVLPDPYRVVIDLPDVTFDLPPGAGRKVRGLIGEFRYGVVDNGRSRIVIDTTGPVLIDKSFIIEPQAGQPARLVVDLVKTSEAAFLKTSQSEALKSQSAAAAAPAPAPLPEEEPVAKPKPGRKLVVIDPGHGGIDPGAIGIGRTKEKDVVLSFAHVLRQVRGRRQIRRRDDPPGDELSRSGTASASPASARPICSSPFTPIRCAASRCAAPPSIRFRQGFRRRGRGLAQKENRSDIIAGLDLDTGNEQVAGILIDRAA